MILFSLTCSAEHEFEAWFRDGAAYDAQAAAREISCPVCADTRVAKAPMAPRIAKGAAPAGSGDAPAPAAGQESADQGGTDAGALPAKPILDPGQREMARVRAAMLSLKKLVEDNCEHVGPGFAREARRIHYGEADSRAIYGDATDEEAEALSEEGISVGRIPWPSASDA